MEKKLSAIENVFTEEHWNKFLMGKEKESAKQEAAVKMKLEEEAATKVASSVRTKGSGNDGINVLYKVETKKIPVLPANKIFKGEIFDEWHSIFYVKMCQAKVSNVLEKWSLIPPMESEEYELHKTKDAF